VSAVLLKNAHVIDPANDRDGVMDVAIEGGVILSVAPAGARGRGDRGFDRRVSLARWIDAHVHAYGTLGFADPDSIGIAQGVTTFVEAGGPGSARSMSSSRRCRGAR